MLIPLACARVTICRTAVLLDPSVKPLIEGLGALHERASKWMLLINESVEIDS
jgi:hypothetical protein